jgi:cytoskeletal protein CcmA (bactofilin family)
MFFKRTKNDSPKREIPTEPSYIARDTSFEGNLICDGEIHIDGALRGSVRAHTCLVDSHGEVHGEITAQNVFIRGRVVGPVNGTHVSIHAGSHVEGNVTHETISIENGAFVFGAMRQGGLTASAQMQQTMQPTIMHEPFFDRSAEIISDESGSDNVRPLKKAKNS